MGRMNLSARKIYLSCRAGTIRSLARMFFFLTLSACLKRLVGGGVIVGPEFFDEVAAEGKNWPG